jgi:hypothetical protein
MKCGIVDITSIHCLSKGVIRRGKLFSSLLRWMLVSFLSKNNVFVIGDRVQSCRVRRCRLKAPPNFPSTKLTRPAYILPRRFLSLRACFICSPIQRRYAVREREILKKKMEEGEEQ